MASFIKKVDINTAEMIAKDTDKYLHQPNKLLGSLNTNSEIREHFLRTQTTEIVGYGDTLH
jgi:hypothetical protein